jgi:serine/threonine-protein kinase RsbT
VACREGRALAERLGFTGVELAHVATAISEIAGNVWRHAGGGRIMLDRREDAGRVGIVVRAVDTGAGIPDTEAALADGWSTTGSMGMGLPGARRLMDEFEIASEPGRGTAVTMTRWHATSPAAGPWLLDWSTAPAAAPAGARALVRRLRSGVLAATIACRTGTASPDEVAALLEAHAGESPIRLAELCRAGLPGGGGVSLALASLSMFDARMTWLALGDAEGLLVGAGGARPRRSSAPRAPRGLPDRPALRAATLTMGPRDALVLVAGRPLPPGFVPAPGAAPRRVAEDLLALLGAGGLALVARRA